MCVTVWFQSPGKFAPAQRPPSSTPLPSLQRTRREIMNITPQTQVSEIVVHNPASTRIFHRHGIDFCCGGKRPLGEVCAERQLDVDQIRREIATLDPSEAEEKDWSAEPLTAIVEHILARYHRPLQEELPRLRVMAQKVVRAHGASFPEMIPPLQGGPPPPRGRGEEGRPPPGRQLPGDAPAAPAAPERAGGRSRIPHDEGGAGALPLHRDPGDGGRGGALPPALPLRHGGEPH